jgi:hypothetical protein
MVIITAVKEHVLFCEEGPDCPYCRPSDDTDSEDDATDEELSDAE